MESELGIIDKIAYQDTGLDVRRYLHLVLDEFMLILHLEVCFLITLYPAEKKKEDHDSDKQYAECD